jgi:hypothetical protein
VTAVEQQERKLRVADRCDLCGAQAFTIVYVNDLDLLFCGHHFTKNEAEFAARGYKVVDERWAINDKPSPSAFGENVGDFDAKCMD